MRHVNIIFALEIDDRGGYIMLSVENNLEIVKETKKRGRKKVNQEKVVSNKGRNTRKALDNEISASLEDYLEIIYLLSMRMQEVRVTDIACEIELSKPSVNRAVRTLTEEGMLTHIHYGAIELTDKGRLKAKEINNKKNTINDFLVSCLGVDEKIASKEADDLKHYIGKNTLRKLKSFVKENKN